MILLLLCIPTVVFGAEIDWTKCLHDRPCFMLDKCKNGNSETLEFYKITNPSDPAEVHTCKTGFQSYAFTDDSILYQFQAEGKMITELSIYHGDKLIVGCKKGEKGEVTLIYDNYFKHKFELFEERSSFEAERAFCSLKMDDLLNFDKTLKQHTEDRNAKNPKIRYLGSDGEPVEYEQTTHGTGVYLTKREHCNPFSFRGRPTLQNYHVLPVKDKDREILDCTNYGPLKYQLMFIRDGQSKEVEKLTCTASHEYEITEKDSSVVPLTKPEKYEFFCAVPIDRICEIPSDVCSSKQCPQINNLTSDAAPTVMCPGGKWLIDGFYYELNDTVATCQPDFFPNKAIFYIALPEGQEIPLSGKTRASCFTNYDCFNKSSLDYSECKSGDASCGALVYTNGTMKCEKPEEYELRAIQPSNETLNATEYKCDVSKGVWKDTERKLELKDGAQVYCVPKTSYEEPQISEADKTTIIIGFVAGTILVVAIGVSLFIFIKGRRVRQLKVKSNKWLKMDAAARLKYAKETFQAVTSAEVAIVHGFNVLEMLLDTNTEDPEVWEEVYPFLLRVKSVMNTIDYNLAYLFTRYLYLRAKKIIDENGWCSQKPITKSNPEGLIRVVAIRLLAHCAFGKCDADARKMIESGFRRLGFNVVSQYPHCGVMWTLAPALTANYRHPDDPARKCVKFNVVAFISRLLHYKKNPPVGLGDADIIPQFGSISDQVMIAIGAFDCPNWHIELIGLMFKSPNKGTREQTTKLLEGLAATISDDIGTRIFIPTAHNHPPTKAELEKAEEDRLKKLAREGKKDEGPPPPPKYFHDHCRDIAPAEVWTALSKKIMKIMMYGQHSLDAKRMSTLMIPEEEMPTEYYMKLREGQVNFCAAIEDQSKDLFLWLTKRTDLEELKVRPTTVKYTPPPKKPEAIKVVEPPPTLADKIKPLDPTMVVLDSNAAADAAAAAAAAAPAAADAAATPAAAPVVSAAAPAQNPQV